MKAQKYYCLYRFSQSKWDWTLMEFDREKRDKINRTLPPNQDGTHDLILIEKTINADSSESISNMWRVQEGCSSNWEKITKKKKMYDYTGVVHPLIHEKGKVFTFDQYCVQVKTAYLPK